MSLEIGKSYLILTRGYHWTGRIVELTALEIVIDETCAFVDIGQFDRAVIGNWTSNAAGRPFPDGHKVHIPRLTCEPIDYTGDLPRDPVGG